MKSILDVLKLFQSNGRMDFCEDLSSIQSIFDYANEYIKPLNKIQHRGGNEPYIADICTKLLNVFRSKGYVDTSSEIKLLEQFDDQFRKITFFLILNTEASFKYDLTNDHAVCHLLNVMPTIPKCLLLACVWALHLDKYFYECISYTPIWFAFQFVEDTVDSLKYADPYETLDRVQNMVKAIYLNIARSDYRAMNTVDKKIILSKYYNVTMDLLRHFFSPDAEKFEKWTKKKLYKYSGYVLKHNLEMILFCFKLYQTKPTMALPCTKYDIYSLMREREPLIDNNSERYSDAVDETLLKLNTTLLNSLQYNVMQVDCHAYLYWVEIDLDDNTTLQRAVGEGAYHLEHLINQNECFQHDVVVQLKTIAIKPQTLEECVAGSTIGEMITKLEKMTGNEPELQVWLRGYLNYGDLVLANEECLETLEVHADHLGMENIKTMILFAANIDFDDDQIVEEKLLQIISKALEHFSQPEIFEIIHYSIESRKIRDNYLKAEQFEQTLIEVFNKHTYNKEPKAFLKLLIQDPQHFYEKVFEEALTSPIQLKHMLDIIQGTLTLSKTYIEDNIKTVIEVKSQVKEQNVQQLIPQFIAGLYSLEIVPSKQFIIDQLYKTHLMKAMQEENTTKVLLIMKIFLQISQSHRFDDIAAPILVMAAQILEYYRWNLLNFSDELVELITKTIEFIYEISKKFLPEASDQDKKWIISKIVAYSPLTRYYYQKFALKKNEPIIKFDQFLHPSGFANATKQEAIKFLCEYLIRCTNKEVTWLAKNSELVGYFWKTMELTCQVVERSGNQSGINCFRYSCNAFFTVLENTFLPQCETTHNKIDLLEKILHFIDGLKGLSIYDELFMNVHLLVVKLIESISTENKDSLHKNVKPILENLSDCEAKTIVLRKFEKCTA